MPKLNKLLKKITAQKNRQKKNRLQKKSEPVAIKRLLSNSLSELKAFDYTSMSTRNIGSWPAMLRYLIAFSVLAITAVTGTTVAVMPVLTDTSRLIEKQEESYQMYGFKARKAAYLPEYREQMKEIESTFSMLLQRLPTDTEVPGLLEDITEVGKSASLKFEKIALMPEVEQEYYVELPINIDVLGGYHDIANFVSAMSNLPRLVSLHDFRVQPVPGDNRLLRVNILAKTYRYNQKGQEQNGGSQ